MVIPIGRTYELGCWCDCFNSWKSHWHADQCEDSSQIFGRIGVIYIYVWPSHSDIRGLKSLFQETRYVWLYIVCHLPVFFRNFLFTKSMFLLGVYHCQVSSCVSGRYGEDDRGRRSLPDPPYIAWCRFAILIACCFWSRKTRGCLVAGRRDFGAGCVCPCCEFYIFKSESLILKNGHHSNHQHLW